MEKIVLKNEIPAEGDNRRSKRGRKTAAAYSIELKKKIEVQKKKFLIQALREVI